MTPIQALILGLVEGITEYLPVSSTGHLIIASSLLGLDTPDKAAAVDAFNIIIQGGAILAVVLLYWPRFVSIFRGVFGGDRAGIRLSVNLIVAFMPAAVLGLLLDDYIEHYLFAPGPVIAALALGGVFMILVDRWRTGAISIRRGSLPRFHAAELELDDLTPLKALGIGALQAVAMIPGTSRSMMTITGGVILGLKPRAAAEFSFLLGVPTLGAACVYKLVKDQLRAGKPLPDGTVHQSLFQVLGVVPVAIGLVVATISAALAVRWLVGFLNAHGLAVFGYYRIALAFALIGLMLGGIVRFA